MLPSTLPCVMTTPFGSAVVPEVKTISRASSGLIAGVSISGWQTVAQTLERRYGYDLAGEQTEITDVFTDNGIATQTGRRKQYNAFGNVTDEYVISGVATTALANLTGFKVRHANFDNAGYMSDTSGASGTSKYFYNLAG